jgi:hypothetical protein
MKRTAPRRVVGRVERESIVRRPVREGVYGASDEYIFFSRIMRTGLRHYLHLKKLLTTVLCVRDHIECHRYGGAGVSEAG